MWAIFHWLHIKNCFSFLKIAYHRASGNVWAKNFIVIEELPLDIEIPFLYKIKRDCEVFEPASSPVARKHAQRGVMGCREKGEGKKGGTAFLLLFFSFPRASHSPSSLALRASRLFFAPHLRKAFWGGSIWQTWWTHSWQWCCNKERRRNYHWWLSFPYCWMSP